LNDSVAANRRAREISTELYRTGNSDFLSMAASWNGESEHTPKTFVLLLCGASGVVSVKISAVGTECFTGYKLVPMIFKVQAMLLIF